MCHDGLTVRDGSAVVPKYRSTPPSQMLAVRSNCRPAVTEKSAASTTLAHGPGHAAGGAKSNSFGVKSANAMPANSGTTHGVVAGTLTGGSAVAVFGEPTVGAALATPATAVKMPAAASATERGRPNHMADLRGCCTVVRRRAAGQ